MIYRASRFRWRATLLMAILFVIVLLVGRQWRQRKPPLNVILITLDTTRADRLGAYGYQNGLTAGFDRYAEDGVVFERAYAPAPITLPSHATMLTGLYPPEHGLRVNGQGRLAREIPLLPEFLKNRGYDTGAFIAAVVLDSKFGLDRGFDLYDDGDASKKGYAQSEQRREGRDVVDRTLSWIDVRSSRPFFCWVHLFDAHGPYRSREEVFGDRFKQNPYDAGVAVELQQVDRVIAHLKERHLDQNTLVVIAGDHGEGLGDHRESEHGMLVYNSTLHVPLVFVGARLCQPGRRVSTTVSLADITPTVLDILGIHAQSHVSGRSLRVALEGGEITARPCYAEAESPFIFNHWCPLRAVISDRWKYIQSTRPEFYDLLEDFSEQRNLVDTAVEERKELENILELMRDSFTSIAPQKLHASDKDLENLGALGYVGVRDADKGADRVKSEVLKDVKDMLPILEKFERAKDLSLKGEIERAIALLREIDSMGEHHEYLESTFLLGDCLVEANRLDEAVAVFRGVLAKHPQLVKTRFRLGSTLARQGEFERAEEEFRNLVQHDPDAAPAHHELARVLVRLQNVEDAVVEYREAIRISPDVSLAHFELGQLLMRLKRPREAVSCFERAIECDPRDAVARASLLSVLVQLGEYEKALDYIRKAVEIDPQSFEARYNLGVFLISRNRFREGVEQLRAAQKLRPDDPRPPRQIQQAEATMKRGGK